MSEELTTPTPFSVPAGVPADGTMRDLGFPNKGVDTIVYVRDPEGNLKDLSFRPEMETVFEPVPVNTPNGCDVIRHPATHMMAQTVQLELPGTRLGINPAIDNGFHCDFRVGKPLSPEGLRRIKKHMEKIIEPGQRSERFVFGSANKAQEAPADEPYKPELIVEKSADKMFENDEVSVDVDGTGTTLAGYRNVGPCTGETKWFDLCRGPHVPTTRYTPAFKITRSSAAHRRGGQSRDNLQRAYGTTWESEEALDEYLDRILEAEKRDHRHLGSELDLFSFPDEIGSDFPVFRVRGGVIYNEMEQHSRRHHIEVGYDFVNTPYVAKGDLFKKSGHLNFYADGMFPPMQPDGGYDEHDNCTKAPQDYYVRPMNCPMHNFIFASCGRSYRELPIRTLEFGTIYRYEKSGVTHGPTRARGFTQDDTHIYYTEDQLKEEFTDVLNFITSLLRGYGLDDLYLGPSTGDEKKSVGSDETWEKPTVILQRIADASDLGLTPDPGGAAFYGPRIPVQTRSAIGRIWRMSTIQLDFSLPECFELEYTAPDGIRKRPIMIHHTFFSSIERFSDILLKHYVGTFPAWLVPEQVVGILVADDCISYLEDSAIQLKFCGIRVHVNTSDDRMQKKIRNHIRTKVPPVTLAGVRSIEAGAANFRFLGGAQINGVAIRKVVDIICDWVASQNNEQPNEENVSTLQRLLVLSNSTALLQLANRAW